MRHREILTIEPDDVVTLIHEAVQARGEDWVYPDTSQCRYVYFREDYAPEGYDVTKDGQKMLEYFGDDDGQPACLVGYVLNALNPKFIDVIVNDGKNEDSVEGWMQESETPFSVQIGETEYVFPPAVTYLLQAAQSAQDSGQTWGSAETRVIQIIEAKRGEY